MNDAVAGLLSRTPVLVREGPFALCAWPPSAAGEVAAALRGTGPAFVLVDERETSALLPEPLPATLPAPSRCERDFALLTLDTELAWDVVGVLAALTAALAAAAVPAGAFAAYSRDHLVVARPRLQEALSALAPLCARIVHVA